MGAIVGVIALIVTLVAVLPAAGHAVYLGMLTSAARKRPGGQPAADFARKRMPIAGVTLGVTVLALLISTGGAVGADIFAMLLGGGGGAAALQALQRSQHQLRSGEF